MLGINACRDSACCQIKQTSSICPDVLPESFFSLQITPSIRRLIQSRFVRFSRMFCSTPFNCHKSRRHCGSSTCQAIKLDVSKSVKLSALASIKMCLGSNAVVASNKMGCINKNYAARTRLRLIHQYTDLNKSGPTHRRMWNPYSQKAWSRNRIKNCVAFNADQTRPNDGQDSFLIETNSESTILNLHYYRSGGLLHRF